MSTFLQTGEGDLDITLGRLSFVSDFATEIMQKLRNRLYLSKGEWYLDTDAGVPYLQSILASLTPASVPPIRRMFANIIAQCPGVAQVLSCDLDRVDTSREFSLTFRAQLTSGEIIAGGPGNRFVVESV